MSRSYKKTPIVKSTPPIYRRFAKRQANKKVRKSVNIADKAAYKRVYQSWSIHDYVSYYPFDRKDATMSVDEWERGYLRK